MSITLGSPHKHVWTFASGFRDDFTCPCTETPTVIAYPFIRQHYFCESGTAGDPSQAPSGGFFTANPLWDGDGCVSTNNNCCTDVGAPWFFRQFPNAQQGNIEVRLCTNEDAGNEGIGVDSIQLFIQ